MGNYGEVLGIMGELWGICVELWGRQNGTVYVRWVPLSPSRGYLTSAVSGAHVWAEWLHYPCSPWWGEIKMATKKNITPAFSGSPWWCG